MRGSSRLASRLAKARRELTMLWRESERVADFASLVRVRMTRSRVGGQWLRRRSVIDVDLVSLGPSVRLRSHSTDINVLGEILTSTGLPCLPAVLDGNTVIDLGANGGLTYRYLQHRYPDARFVCVEPAADNLQVLRENVAATTARCEIVACAIGGTRRRAAMSTVAGEWGYRLQGDEVSGTLTVEVIVMDDLLASYDIERVGVLKCDIEGAEAELFADCASWIDRIGAMVVECHDEFLPASSLLEVLERNGGSFRVLDIEPNPGVGDIVTLVAHRR